MLNDRERIKYEIFDICNNSGDIEIGETFNGVMNNNKLNDIPCVCIGKTRNERLFRTEDRTCYFTVYGGWGKKDGKLVGIEIGSFLRFDKPAGAEEIREYINNKKHSNSWSGAMARHAETTYTNWYIKALEELEENKNERKNIQPHECG